MKLKKLTACLLAAALTFSAFAPVAQAAEVSTAVGTASSQAIVPEEAASLMPDAASFSAYTVTLPAGATSIVQEIKMNHAGYIYIPMSISGSERYMDAKLFSDAACTAKVGYSCSLGSGILSNTISTTIRNAGTYYLQFTVAAGMASNVDITLNPYCFNSSDRKISPKEEVFSYSGNDDMIYHKISIPKNGYITVDAAADTSIAALYIYLLDSSKEPLSEGIGMSSGDRASFAVKKGTYYIGTKRSSIVRLKYAFTAVTEKSGSSKKKAVTIKKGKTVKGLIQYSDKTTKYDYYKVKLTKSQILSLTVNTKSADQLTFKIIPANSRLTFLGGTKSIYGTAKETLKTRNKLPAGTYYIQVSKSKSNVSGYYSIKFN